MLKEIEYLWAVTYTSRDDGHRLTAAVFTDRKEAEKHCRERACGIDQKVVQSSLWMDTDSGKYYEVTKREVDVDGPVHRERAWAKLSPAERKALGVTSRSMNALLIDWLRLRFPAPPPVEEPSPASDLTEVW